MNTERSRLPHRPLAWALALSATALLGGCQYKDGSIKSASDFGEANRQTLMAQVIDPDPQYEFLDPATSGDHAAQAIDRYRKGMVKQPDKVTSTSISSGGGGGS